ncbi:MAG TPA: hypothetical protein VJ746_02445 [Nitrospira sp.]|nr:hypothetical protein [Nitrospira sp.]
MKKHRAARASPPSAKRESNLVPLSCPDCFGVLRFEREGPHGHLLYRCQVDHRYTGNSLLHAKELHLERTLWSAVLLLRQMTYAYEDLLDEIKQASGAERRRVQRRINEVRKQCLAIRSMIEATHAAE